MFDIMKRLTSKLDDKIKSGEINQSELISEGMGLLSQMKDIPGIGSLLSKMNLGSKGGKMNVSAMENKLKHSFISAKLKEQMRAKLIQKQQKKEQEKQKEKEKETQTQNPALTEEELIKIFSTGEKVEKTPRKKGKGKKGK